MTLQPRPSDAELLARAQQRAYHAEQRANAAQNALAITPGPNAITSAIKATRTRKPKNDDPEHREQVELFRRIRAPDYDMPELGQAYAVPNAGRRGPLTRAKLLEEGLTAGEFDINLDLARGGFFGLRLEMKARGRSLSSLQHSRYNEHEANGYRPEVAYGADEAEQIMRAYATLKQTEPEFAFTRDESLYLLDAIDGLLGPADFESERLREALRSAIKVKLRERWL